MTQSAQLLFNMQMESASRATFATSPSQTDLRSLPAPASRQNSPISSLTRLLDVREGNYLLSGLRDRLGAVIRDGGLRLEPPSPKAAVPKRTSDIQAK